jgi:peroxiredoxin
VTGKTVRRDDFRGSKALLVMFICAHCPYVKHIEKGLAALGQGLRRQAVGIVAISSNDATTHPADSPAGLKQQAETASSFPILYDETQAVARAYKAACTPDFFLFDGDLRLVYRGQFDAAAPATASPSPAKTCAPPSTQRSPASRCPKDQRPSIGCNIKWKA